MRNDQAIQRIKEKSLEIYQHYLGQLFPYGSVKTGVKISNPFLPEKQETPSFNIYKGYHGDYLYKDFATGDLGDVISFVQKLERVDRYKAIQIIKNQIL